MFRRLGLVFLLLVIVLGFLFRKPIMNFFRGQRLTSNKTEVKLLLKSSPSKEELATILVDNGILPNKKLALAEIQNQNLGDESFAAGKYIILSQTRIPDLIKGFALNEFGEGNAEVKVRVIFNRCNRIEDIGANISKCIEADSASIVNYIRSKENLSSTGFNEAQVSSLFLPDEYEMYYDTDAKEFVEYMNSVHREFWNEERTVKMHQLGFKNTHEVSTLASIVYSEQGKVSSEWSTISALYLNRLKQGIRLQSDPTFKFCWGGQLDGVQRLLKKHREIDCPYNTYLYAGLPPGPICIVPSKVIDAVLTPASVDYIFMCAKPDYSGEHNFTSSSSQHLVNARIYQNWLAKELRR